MFGSSRRKGQGDLMALRIDQFDGMAINVITIGDMPGGRERIALLLRRVQLKDLCNVQKLTFATIPGGKQTIRPRTAYRTTTQ